MRTYDKLIATIFSSQRTEGLRPTFGENPASGIVAKARSRATLQDKTKP